MKKLTCIVLFTVSIVFAVTCVTKADEQNSSRQLYEKSLDHMIECCTTKSKMCDSKGSNIRKIGEQARQKVEFCKLNKQKLIADMERIDLETKPYKIIHFINAQFSINSRK